MPYFHLLDQVIQCTQQATSPRQSRALSAWNNSLDHSNNAPDRQRITGRKMLSNNYAGEIHVSPPKKTEQPFGLMDFVKAARSCIQGCSADELQSKIDNGEDMLLVDVCESSEHEQGHLPGALLIPRCILEVTAEPGYSRHVPELANARHRQVVRYCATGERSAMVAAVLRMMGFKTSSA